MFSKEISSKITSVWGRIYPCRELLFVPLPDSSSPLELDNKLSDQSARPSGTSFAIIAVAPFLILNYPKENLKQILKTVLEAQASITSEESINKLLKARFPDVYCGKSHMECYNFYQQFEDYFTIIRAKDVNQILFATSFL